LRSAGFREVEGNVVNVEEQKKEEETWGTGKTEVEVEQARFT